MADWRATAMARGKVFLVDDDASVRKALDRLIRAFGYEVQPLADAASFLMCSVPALPACLVLDIRMPGMSGLELKAAIEGTSLALPVVFITGHGDEDVRSQALASGAVDVLFKPLDAVALFEAIERRYVADPGRKGRRSTGSCARLRRPTEAAALDPAQRGAALGGQRLSGAGRSSRIRTSEPC